MNKTLLLQASGGLEGKVAVSKSLQIGRSTSEQWNQWAVEERQQPPEFIGLEAFLHVGKDKVSRNHVAITQRSDGYYVVDLNSKNGTYLNGENINPQRHDPQLRLLQDGDIIGLAEGAVQFRVSFIEFRNYALLIATQGDHPGAVDNTLQELENELVKRKYLVHVLRGEQATKQAVRDKIREISRVTVPESSFLFSFYGHGNFAGVQLGGQIMNPRELYKEMERVRAKTAVIIEACHAGGFVEGENANRIPEGMLVLTASGAGNLAGETMMLGQEQEYIGRFTKSLVEYLRSHPEEFSLKDFYRSINQRGNQRLILQEPKMAGTTYVLPRATSLLDLER